MGKEEENENEGKARDIMSATCRSEERSEQYINIYLADFVVNATL